MKAPLSWIKELVPGFKGSARTLADLLTKSGTEVEGIEGKAQAAVLECAVTSNRVDCLGVVGLAREIAAIRGLPLSPPNASITPEDPPAADRVRVTVQAPDFCPRYCAFVVEGLSVGPSPAWLVERLEAMGVRPINNVVDVTNLVMLELNQPLHAFDLDRLRGGAIVVRRAAAGEKIAALNERTYDLQPWMGVIADAEGPVAIAGVMGGLDSAVTASTRRIVIESAFFDPPSVRRTSRALALRSDSSYRFERGIDAAGTPHAGCRAARLIVETAGGVVRSSPIDLDARPALAPQPITLRHTRVKDVTGAHVASSRVIRILEALGCQVAAGEGRALLVTPPTWRADLTREIDLVEEVIRIVGFDRVPEGDGLTVRPVSRPPLRRLVDALTDRLVGFGFLECITPTFIAEGADAAVTFLDEGAALSVRNPVRAGEGVIRRSLLPSLLAVRQHNQDQGNDDLRLFEVAALAFDKPGGLPRQLQAAGMLVDGDFRDLKGVIEAVAGSFAGGFAFDALASPHFESGRQVAIRCCGRTVGAFGVVAPDLVAARKLHAAPVYAELDLVELTSLWEPIHRFRDLPRFPAVRRDLAFTLDAAGTYGQLEAAIRGAAGSDLESVEFFDEYRGPQVGPGRKSLALTCVFRAPDRTLQTSDIDARVAAIVRAAAESCGASLRV